ncbi:MAG: hypothetical protein Q8O79_06275 [Pseudomonadota bacterium]|nr:hypothetical protein [Pseudomonadota bacterium]
MSVTLHIPEAQAARLERLAAETGNTPEALLPFILEDGFEFHENAVRKIKAGIVEADAGKTSSHDEVMAYLDTVIEAHGSQKAA